VNFDLGQEPGATHIVARVLEASITNTEFTLNGSDFDTHDGSCIRDYVHVWDLAQAHIKGFEFLNKNSDSEQTAGSYVFNLGTNAGISNWEIVKFVSTTYGLDRLLVQSRRQGDPDVLIADASLANDVLNWFPEYSDIDTIINSAHKWYTRV
jgi:UDP-glucose 4-epimerase